MLQPINVLYHGNTPRARVIRIGSVVNYVVLITLCKASSKTTGPSHLGAGEDIWRFLRVIHEIGLTVYSRFKGSYQQRNSVCGLDRPLQAELSDKTVTLLAAPHHFILDWVKDK